MNRTLMFVLLLAFSPAGGTAAAEKPVLPGIDPARGWEIFIVQHTHTDLGYTEPQPEILREHLRFIDEAVRFCRETDDYPEEARFRWTCEVTYGVEGYLRNRPPEAARALLEEIRRGRIEVAALPGNMTDLATEEVLIRALQAIRELRALGIPIRAALQCDNNGFPWALPRLLADAGVPYFANASNETRSRIPWRVPTAIRWESPDGSSVLAWRGFHYHVANHLGLATSLEEAEKKIPGALAELEKKGYPYGILLLQVSGYFTDNSPPAKRPCDIVRAWNAKWSAPRLRTATLSEWFRALEERAGDKVERLRVGWPDWWADGNGSAPLEVSLVREAQEKLAAADALLCLSGLGLGEEGRTYRERLRAACGNAFLFDEHTFGAASSVSDPGGLPAKLQWGFKQAFAFAAAEEAVPLKDAGTAAIVQAIGTGDEPAIALVNPTSWVRSETIQARIPEWALPEKKEFRILDPSGNREVPYQILQRGQSDIRIAFRAEKVPPMGYRTLKILPGAPAQVPNPFRFDAETMVSDLYRVAVDPKTGAIASLRDLTSGGAELADMEGPYRLNQFIRETIADPRGREALWPIRTDAKILRETLQGAKIEKGLAGPILASLRVSGKLGEVSLVQEIILHRGEPRIDIVNTVRKPGSAEPEAFYFAFPFHLRKPEVRAEVVGGVLRPGEDQVPGMATDWHSVQRWVRLEEGGRGIAWVTLDAPLVQFGDLNVGKYLEKLPPRRPTFFSWALNNYWFTNFPAVQSGQFAFRYSIAPLRGPGSDSQARRIARARSVPICAAAIPARQMGPLPAEGASAMILDCPVGASVAALQPAEDGDGAILRIEEEDGAGRKAFLRIHPAVRVEKASRVNILEESRGDLALSRDDEGLAVLEIQLKPREIFQVRLSPFLWR